MAKRNNRRKNIVGISEAAKQAIQSEIESKHPTIELPIAGGELAAFVLATIPYGEIKAKTTVIKSNARHQRNLNAASLDYILVTMRATGQQYPAIGYYDNQGMLWVIDGSSRRAACMIAEKDFLIYVTNQHLTPGQSKYLTRIASAQKELSLFEKGAVYEEMLSDGTYSSATELATCEGVSESAVSDARIAYQTPTQIIDFIPDLGAIGRPSLMRIRKAVAWAKDNSKTEDLFALAESLTIDCLKNTTGGESSSVLNAAFVAAICNFASSPRKTKKTEPLASNGSAKCFLTESKNGFNLKLENIEDTKKAAIIAAIKDEINR